MKKLKLAAVTYLIIFFFLDLSNTPLSWTLSILAVALSIWLWNNE